MSEARESNVEIAHNLNGGDGHGRLPSVREDIVEILEALVLALVAIATAWSGYEASSWNGRQSELYGQSGEIRLMADQVATLGNQERLYDAIGLNAWLTAVSRGDMPMAAIFVRRFRSEFKEAFAAWMKTDPLHNSTAPPSPAAMAEYHNANLEQAQTLSGEASEAFERGTKARATGDAYVRCTVLLSIVMLFTAISRHFRIKPVRTSLLIVGSALLCTAIWSILTLPRI